MKCRFTHFSNCCHPECWHFISKSAPWVLNTWPESSWHFAVLVEPLECFFFFLWSGSLCWCLSNSDRPECLIPSVCNTKNVLCEKTGRQVKNAWLDLWFPVWVWESRSAHRWDGHTPPRLHGSRLTLTNGSAQFCLSDWNWSVNWSNFST